VVELGLIADPRMVANAVAAALRVGERGRTTLAKTLADILRGQQLLLLLDNCEHVLDGCAKLAHDLLRACPRLTIRPPVASYCGSVARCAGRFHHFRPR
jgi:predicted ATPase